VSEEGGSCIKIWRARATRGQMTGWGAAGIFALVAAGAAWEWWAATQATKLAKERQIQATEQRNQAQLTQSRFLADLGKQRITVNDAGTALALALEALPDPIDGVARPYAPEAEVVLLGTRQRLKEIAVLGH